MIRLKPSEGWGWADTIPAHRTLAQSYYQALLLPSNAHIEDLADALERTWKLK